MGVIAAQGEGKDYWADNILMPLVRAGKVEGKYSTTIASLVGAMDKNNLSKIGVGTLQKYHRARLVVSEMQTWSESMWGVILPVLANGKVIRSVGQLHVERPACLNMWFMGNPPTKYDPDKDDDPLMMLDGFGQRYRIQMISRLSLIFARLKISNVETKDKLMRIYKNLDVNSRTMGKTLFENDEVLQSLVYSEDSDAGRSRRGRKRFLARSRDLCDDDIEEMIRVELYQKFFREYLKYVSGLKVEVIDAVPHIERCLDRMRSMDEYSGILVVRGEIDMRKRLQFANIVRSFTKLNGKTKIDSSDLREAEQIFEESAMTMSREFPMALLRSGMSTGELDTIRFIGNNPGCNEKDIMGHLDCGPNTKNIYYGTMQKLMDGDMVYDADGEFFINQANIGKDIIEVLGIEGDDSLASRMKLAGVGKKDDELDKKIKRRFMDLENDDDIPLGDDF